MLGFKSFRSAQITLAGIELIMLKKRQMQTTRGDRLSPVNQFYGFGAVTGRRDHTVFGSLQSLRQNRTNQL